MSVAGGADTQLGSSCVLAPLATNVDLWKPIIDSEYCVDMHRREGSDVTITTRHSRLTVHLILERNRLQDMLCGLNPILDAASS